MATTVAILEAKLTTDRSDFDRGIHGAESGMQRAQRTIHRAAFAMGAAIATGLGVVAKVGWDEFKEGQQVTAQTAAVLESTGGVANVTAKQVQDLANALMRKSGVDDEVIASGENVLLTFRGIRNEVGKGNDIFNQATKATLDLSVAMHRDLNSSAVMVGKALQDPIRGLTALRRVGVQFTKAQEEQIKALVESGRTMDAQKMILRELNKEFGGSAEAVGKTLPGQLAILREQFNDFAGQLVAEAIPRLQAFVALIRRHTTVAKVAVGVIASLVAAILTMSAILKVIGLVRGLIMAVRALNVAMLFLAANPVVLVIAALVALGIALVVAYKKSQTFRNIVSAAIDFVKRHWQLLLLAFGPLPVLIATAVKHFGTLRAKATAAIDAIAGPIIRVIGWVRTFVGWIQTAISALARLGSAIRAIPTPHIPHIPGVPNIPGIPGFQHGGAVPGPLGAPRLVLAHGGETILPTHRPGWRGAGATINFYAPNYLGREETLMDSFRRMVNDYERRNGRSPF